MIKRNKLANKSVLIVDDDEINIFALKTALEVQQMNVFESENGQSAIDLLKNNSNKVDVILMDMRMPELSGYDAIPIIRQEDACKNIPIIGLTAQALHGDREKVINAGANAYISKPVKFDQLTQIMEELID